MLGPPKDVTINALDGQPLVGTLFEGEEPQAVLLINSGTGIPRWFYARLATYAAERNWIVLTYDYRGIGGSAPSSLRGYSVSFRDWGQQDIAGAIHWLSERYPTLKLYVLGHSAGGQQLGLANNVHRVQAAVFVTVSTGYWRGMPLLYGYFTLGLWKAYFPLTGYLYGYVPAKKLRLGENLPVGVVREWGAWCLEPNYMAAFFDEEGGKATPDGTPFGPTYFDQVDVPIRAYYFPDDPIATKENASPMLALYRQASIEEHWIHPTDLGVKKIGHLRFFRSEVGRPLWDDTLNWLLSQ